MNYLATFYLWNSTQQMLQNAIRTPKRDLYYLPLLVSFAGIHLFLLHKITTFRSCNETIINP